MADDRVEELKKKIIQFRDDRDWMQFHKPKDMAVSITIEAAELLEHFQWKNEGEVERKVREDRESIQDELADIYIYVLELSDNLGIDLVSAAEAKIAKNAAKYPVEKARGSAKKYTEL